MVCMRRVSVARFSLPSCISSRSQRGVSHPAANEEKRTACCCYSFLFFVLLKWRGLPCLRPGSPCRRPAAFRASLFNHPLSIDPAGLALRTPETSSFTAQSQCTPPVCVISLPPHDSNAGSLCWGGGGAIAACGVR